MLFNRIQQMLAPPVFEGAEDKTRSARLLNTFVLFMLAVIVILSIGLVILSPSITSRLMIVAPVSIALVLVFGLTRRGQVQMASVLLVSSAWLALTITAAAGGGIRTPIFAGYVLLVLLTGLLLGTRASLGIAGLSIAVDLGMVHAEEVGLFPAVPVGSTPLTLWFSQAVLLLAAVVLLHLTITIVSESLVRARLELEDRKRVERALRESEKRYRSLFENMLDGFAYCKMLYDDKDRPVDFVYLDVNNAFDRLTGLKNVVGKRVTEVIPGIKESNPELFEIYSRVALTGNPEEFELDFKPLARWLSISVYSTERGYFIAVFDNITERKQAEAALRESEERYRHLVELTPDAIFVHAERRFVLANPAGAALFGAAQPQDLIGQPILDRVHPDYREIVIERNRQMDKQRRQAALIEEKFLRMDGTAVDVEATAMPFIYQGKPAVQVVARDITERKLAERQIQLQLLHLSALHTIDTAITGSFDLHVILNIFLEQVTTHLGVAAAAVLMLHPFVQTLEYVAERGFHTRLASQPPLRLDNTLAGKAVMERRIVQVQPPSPLEKHSLSARASEEFVAYCGIPLIAKGQVKGVLEIYGRASLPSDQGWLRFLETLATQAAIAIDNTTLFGELQQSNYELSLAYDTTLEGWSRALDLRDKENEGHTQRVVDHTLRLARALGTSPADLVHVRRGALLHDIGKMGIPDSILLKAGPLTDQEWTIMRKHPVYAFELLSPITFLRAAIDIPYCHHEKWNGAGYPRALKGEEIPLAARIFAVVDVWDALRSDRPYRQAWSKQKAYAYIRAESGKHFDDRIAKIFLEMVKDE